MCDYINLSEQTDDEFQAFLYDFISSPEGETFLQELGEQPKIKTEPIEILEDTLYSPNVSCSSSECSSPEPYPSYLSTFELIQDVNEPLLSSDEKDLAETKAPCPIKIEKNQECEDCFDCHQSCDNSNCDVTIPIRVEVILLQKKRGTGGVWQPVLNNERIRVDKNKGKILKLAVKMNGSPIDFKDFNVDISLINLLQPEVEHKEGDGFSFLQVRSASELIGKEIKFKLSKICKNQRFILRLFRAGATFTGISNDFRSDDNGKVTTTVRAKRKEVAVAPSIPGCSPKTKFPHFEYPSSPLTSRFVSPMMYTPCSIEAK